MNDNLNITKNLEQSPSIVTVSAGDGRDQKGIISRKKIRTKKVRN